MLKRSTSAFNIYSFRFLYCTTLAYFFSTRALFFWKTKESGIFQGLLVLKPFVGAETTPWQMYLAISILCGSLLLAALSWHPRLMLTIALLSHINIFAPMNLEFRPYDDNIIFFNLLVMAFYANPRGKTASAWMFELIKVNLSIAYFSAFVSKILNGGLEWGEGYTLQNYLLERHFMTGNQLAFLIAQSHALCTLLSIFTLVVEGFFWVVLLPGRWTTIMIWSGFLLHVGVYMMMTINFKVFAATYLVFIPYDKIYGWLKAKYLKLALKKSATRQT